MNSAPHSSWLKKRGSRTWGPWEGGLVPPAPLSPVSASGPAVLLRTETTETLKTLCGYN